MKVLDTFRIRGRGVVAHVDLDEDGPLAGQTLVRPADGARWEITGVEWWALPRTTAANGLGTTRPGKGDRVGVLVRDLDPPREGDEVAFEREPSVDLDGMMHTKGGDCCMPRVCRRCGGREHFQGIYGGYLTACETCEPDRWGEARERLR